MKKMLILIAAALFTFCTVGCSENENNTKDLMEITTESTEEVTEMKNENVKIKITVGDNTATAILEDNPTSRAFIDKLPITLPMLDLYGREMCYRFDEELPTDSLRYDGYDVGDIAYWPPRHSFVILYKQNGEEFERQHLGHIETGIEFFNGTGDTDVTFEIME